LFDDIEYVLAHHSHPYVFTFIKWGTRYLKLYTSSNELFFGVTNLIIVCTGITGSGRKQVISSMVELARNKGIDIQIKNIGQMMY
jgi:hypothetical protein